MVEIVNADNKRVIPHTAPLGAEEIVRQLPYGPVNGVEAGFVESDTVKYNPETGNFGDQVDEESDRNKTGDQRVDDESAPQASGESLEPAAPATTEDRREQVVHFLGPGSCFPLAPTPIEPAGRRHRSDKTRLVGSTPTMGTRGPSDRDYGVARGQKKVQVQVG